MSDNNTPVVVLVTGASGFLAGHIIKLLLTNKQHSFIVHGTVRSLLNNKSKYSYLYDIQVFPNQLILFECNLTNKKNINWKKAMIGCTYVLHTANPTLNRDQKSDIKQQQTEEQYVTIVMNGMRNIFETILEINSMEDQRIKRIIYTSSINAMEYNTDLINSPSNVMFINDTKWSIVDKNHWQISAYTKCKTLAEKYAWNFIENTLHSCELICIHPGAILGPLLNKRKAGSLDYVRLPTIGEYPFIPQMCTALVDVRDVAKAHLNAIFIDINEGKENKNMSVGSWKNGRRRYICVNQCMWFHDICRILHYKYYDIGYGSIPSYVAPNFIWYVIALFEPILAQAILPNLNVLKIFNNQPIMNDLHISFIPIEETIYDTIDSLIQYGFIEKPATNWKSIRKYKQIACKSVIGIGLCCITLFMLDKYFLSIIPRLQK